MLCVCVCYDTWKEGIRASWKAARKALSMEWRSAGSNVLATSALFGKRDDTSPITRALEASLAVVLAITFFIASSICHHHEDRGKVCY